MHKRFLIFATYLCAMSVALGAFAAHGLKQMKVTADTIQTFETGVKYMFYHSFATIIVAILWKEFASKTLRWAGNCFLAGILLFSGSLFLLTFLHDTQSVGLRNIGIITPFGGIFFIVGWFLIGYSVYVKK